MPFESEAKRLTELFSAIKALFAIITILNFCESFPLSPALECFMQILRFLECDKFQRELFMFSRL
jgi:hypothetical protein